MLCRCLYTVHLVVVSEDVQSTRITHKCKYCMSLEYNPEHLQCSVIFAFDAFNKVNRLVREIVEKGPALRHAAGLLLQTEQDMRREVLLASLGEHGPECMRTCIDNVTKLKRIPPALAVIDARAKALYEALKEAARLLVFPDRYPASGGGESNGGSNGWVLGATGTGTRAATAACRGLQGLEKGVATAGCWVLRGPGTEAATAACRGLQGPDTGAATAGCWGRQGPRRDTRRPSPVTARPNWTDGGSWHHQRAFKL